MTADVTLTASSVISDTDRRRIIVGVLICMLLAALDQTIIAPVIPTLGATLGNADYISWIISAYFLTATATTPLYGKIADIYGRRPILFVSIAIFVAGSVVCALSPSMAVLVFGRAIQGLGGGGLMALAQTIIADLMPPKERGRIAGYVATMWGIASIAGPVVGGVVAEHSHWSLIFWLNLPLAAVAVLMSNDALKRLPFLKRDHTLDVLGSLMVVGATVAFMLALALAPQPNFGWTSWPVLALVVLAAALVPLIIRHLAQAPEPLIPLEILRNRIVMLATSSLFLLMVANVGLYVFMPLFLELVLGETAAHAGLALVALMIGTVVGANIAGRSLGRTVHYKRLPIAGLVLAIAGLVWLGSRAGTVDLWEFEILLFVIGAGSGGQFPLSTVVVQNAVDPRDIGVATGVLSFMRALGSSLGVAVLGAVGAASGIAISMGDGGAAMSRAALVRADGWLFTPVFFAAAVSLALSFVLLMLMPELPLRGRGPAATVAAAKS